MLKNYLTKRTAPALLNFTKVGPHGGKNSANQYHIIDIIDHDRTCTFIIADNLFFQDLKNVSPLSIIGQFWCGLDEL